MKEKLKFNVIDENDNEHESDIYSVYKLLKTNKYYMIYTDNTYDEEGALNLYPAIFDPNDDTVFEDLQTEYEWNEANKRIEEMRVKNEYN